MSPMLIALGAMFLQQTFASVGKTLPAVVAPLVIAELHADPAWVGVYYGLAAAASLFAQMGCGSFIVRYGALRMSQVALVLLGGGMAVAAEGGLLGFGASAIIGGGGAAVSTPTSSQLLGRVSPPRLVMAGLALGMAGSVALTGLFSPAWPIAAIGLVGAVVSATAVSWHGILLSETAQLAPAGRVGAVTGGVLSFGQIGAFAGPLIFSLLLHLTGDYGAGWAVCAIPAVWVGIALLRPRAAAERGEALTAQPTRANAP